MSRMKHNKDYKSRLLMTGILFLASLIVQVNLVYACQMMDQQLISSCCCDEMPSENRDSTGESSSCILQYTTDDCCQVNVSVTTDEKISNSVSSFTGKHGAYLLQIQLLILPVSDLTLCELETNRYISTGSISPGNYGSDTYLITQRLRI
jgi:hypothetical protein